MMQFTYLQSRYFGSCCLSWQTRYQFTCLSMLSRSVGTCCLSWKARNHFICLSNLSRHVGISLFDTLGSLGTLVLVDSLGNWGLACLGSFGSCVLVCLGIMYMSTGSLSRYSRYLRTWHKSSHLCDNVAGETAALQPTKSWYVSFRHLKIILMIKKYVWKR